jgi:hypothetical protein
MREVKENARGPGVRRGLREWRAHQLAGTDLADLLIRRRSPSPDQASLCVNGASFPPRECAPGSTDSMQVGQCAAGGAVYGPAGAAGCPAGRCQWEAAPGRCGESSGGPVRVVIVGWCSWHHHLASWLRPGWCGGSVK